MHCTRSGANKIDLTIILVSSLGLISTKPAFFILKKIISAPAGFCHIFWKNNSHKIKNHILIKWL
jgi:hypothetical protein